MTSHEKIIINDYADSVGQSRSLVMKVFKKGSSLQRKIDIIALEATLIIKKAVKDGVIKINKKGEIRKTSLKKYDQLIQEFLVGKKDKPEFFTNPLPIRIKTKTKDASQESGLGQAEPEVEKPQGSPVKN